MPLSCKYAKGGSCLAVEWVVAYMCNHCKRGGTADLCELHYGRMYDNSGRGTRLSCSTCQGSISWVGESLNHEKFSEQIR